jgi:hypothetical protein
MVASRQIASRLLSSALQDGNSERAIAGVRAIVRELDPELPIYDVSTMQQLVALTAFALHCPVCAAT